MNKVLLTTLGLVFLASSACAVTRPCTGWQDDWVQSQEIRIPLHTCVSDIYLERFISEGRFSLPAKEVHFSYSPSGDGGVKTITALYAVISSNVEVLGIGNGAGIQSELIAQAIATQRRSDPKAAARNFSLIHRDTTFTFRAGEYDFS